MTRRLFVALDLPRELKESIERELLRFWSAPVRGWRFEPVEKWHLTLKFLGEVTEDRMPELLRISQEMLDELGRRFLPLRLEVRSAGVFPGPRRPRVFWLGIAESEKEGALIEAARFLDERFRPLGFEPEARAFVPHLTIARFGRRGRPSLRTLPDGLLEQFSQMSFGTFEVREWILFESRPRHGYLPLVQSRSVMDALG